MREIKFRAWDSRNKLMTYDDFDISATGQMGYFLLHSDSFDVDDAILMQFTGLKDKNGKEIYEGDIVEFMGGTCDILPCGIYQSNNHKIGARLVVEYLLLGYTLRLPKHVGNGTSNLVGNVHQYVFWNHARSLKIIGNIYENPELIKENV